jgi:tRNA dimethylallyltransferase
MRKEKIIFLVGPTASGKTETAVRFARKINAEIISCDSMQVYKGMEIVTSKPSPALRKAIPHHLLDVVSPAVEYNVSRYRREALKKIKEIFQRGKVPLFVGGTGLYLTILLDGIFQAKTEDPRIRDLLYKKAARSGSAALHKALTQVDPEAAAKIHPHDTRRIVRALEVFRVTGKPISLLQKQRRGLAGQYAVRVFCLNPRREMLYQRIEKRLEKMFRRGLLKEIKGLSAKKLGRTASCAIGIKELKGHLSGEYSLEEAKVMMALNTRHYACRQLTWFRKDQRIAWVAVKNRETPGELARRIWKKLY